MAIWRPARPIGATIAEGQALLRAMHGRLSGLCQPTYVLDIPGGHGKSPIGPAYIERAATPAEPQFEVRKLPAAATSIRRPWRAVEEAAAVEILDFELRFCLRPRRALNIGQPMGFVPSRDIEHIGRLAETRKTAMHRAAGTQAEPQFEIEDFHGRRHLYPSAVAGG